MADGSRLLRTTQRADQVVGRRLERAANTSQAAAVLMMAAGGARLAGRLLEAARGAAVHALNLPSRRDVALLDAKVQRLQRALEEWSAESRELE